MRGEDGWEKDGGCEMVRVWGGGKVEEVGGGGWRRWVGEGKPSSPASTARQVRFYCSEIILGLDHMHNRFVVYRDLKVRGHWWK